MYVGRVCNLILNYVFSDPAMMKQEMEMEMEIKMEMKMEMKMESPNSCSYTLKDPLSDHTSNPPFLGNF